MSKLGDGPIEPTHRQITASLITHDEAISKFETVTPPRAAMTGPHCIRHRMAQDLRELAALQGTATRDDLLALGWTREQIDAHGPGATVLAMAALTVLDDTGAESGLADDIAREGAIDAQIATLAEIAATARRLADRIEGDIAELQRRHGRPA